MKHGPIIRGVVYGTLFGLAIVLIGYFCIQNRIVIDADSWTEVFGMILLFPIFLLNFLHLDKIMFTSCTNQPDDCGLGLLFFSVVIGWPIIGAMIGGVIGYFVARKTEKKSHAEV